jgi:uncharacterized protein (DUF305 family)
MRLFPHFRFRPMPALLAVVFLGATGAVADSLEETQFIAESNSAMAEMIEAAHIKPSGDVDVDFVAMMIPHH